MVSGFQTISNASRAARAVICGLGLMALTACDLPGIGGPSGPTTLLGNTRPVDVALLVPSGTGVDELETIAASLENAARLAASDLSGVEVNLTVYSTQRNSATAVAAARQAVADGADVILGPLDGEVAAAVGLAMQAEARNVLTFSNNTAIAGGNVFLLGQTFQDSARRVASYAARLGKTNMVVVHADNVAGQAGLAAARDAAARTGITVSSATSYENTLPGIASVTSTVNETIEATGADAVFLTAPSAGALPLLAELLPEAGVDPAEVQYLGLARWDLDARLFTLEGVQGGWFAMPDRARQAAFNGRYTAATGSSPHPLAFTAYDGIAIIGALWASGEAVTAEALTQPSGFRGSLGPILLRSDGTNQRGLAIGSIQEGEVVTIDAAPTGFGAPGF